MRNKIINFKPLSRNDISNPFHDIDHDELLKRAKVVDLTDNYTIVRSDSKRIVIKPINPRKHLSNDNR